MTTRTLPIWYQSGKTWRYWSASMFSDIMSASQYVTISALKPILHRLSTTELAPQTDDLPLTCEIKESVLRRLKARYVVHSLKLLMNVACFLDPRYKTDFLTANTSDDDVDENEPAEPLDEGKEELLKNAVFLEMPVEDVLPVPVAKKAKLSLGALTSLKKSEKTSSSPATSPRSHLSKEIDRYISAFPVIDGDDDPLQWWKINSKKIPLLCQLSRRYLAIQASSSPSKRLFSKAGQVSTPARAQLKLEKVDKLVFLAENL